MGSERTELPKGDNLSGLPTAGKPPPVVSDHQLLRCIGSGSYGEVWLARSVLGNWRAVKVVYRSRFRDGRPYEREFQGILNIEPLSRAHEGLVDILHVGRHEPAGYFYYVMELADDVGDHALAKGDFSEVMAHYQPHTLAYELKRIGRLPLAECVRLGLILSGALSHLHQKRLIHRDIKPANVLYVGGVPKLGDIGLVGEIGESGSYVGTQGYMPPEGPGTPQADVFSLGKVLYEASTGQDRLDFPSLPPVLEEATQPQAAELNEVVLKACAPNPRDRYATAEEMHADLALLHRGESARRRRRTWQRWRLAGLAVNAAMLAVGLCLGLLWSPLRWWTGDAGRLGNLQQAARSKPQPVDLSGFYNASFTTNWMNDFEGNDMASLPQGTHLFIGIPFDARGLVQLAGQYSPRFPPKVEGIPVKRKCRRLHFLHSTHWHAEQGQRIGAYLVHYVDGSEWEIPLNYGEDIGSWWRNPQLPRTGERTTIAWTGTNAPASRSRFHELLALYETTWENPYPHTRIDTIDFVSSLTPCSPFLVAITAE